MNDLELISTMMIAMVIGGGCIYIIWNNPDA